MTDFTKTKIHFALALLGTLFALHPFLDRFADYGFDYLGFQLKVFYAYDLLALMLAIVVYSYALALVSERPHSWMERTGNSVYALSIIVVPLFGGLYLSSLLADLVGHSHLAWAAPSVALGLGILWLIGSQLLAWRLRRHLGHQDRHVKTAQLAKQEIAALMQARELLEHEHYDLSVIDSWKAVEARLRRVLLSRELPNSVDNPEALIGIARKAGVVNNTVHGLLQVLRTHWATAVSVEPVGREAAEQSLAAARTILATIAVHEPEKELPVAA